MKTLLIIILAITLYSNASAQNTFRSPRYDYELVTPSQFQKSSKSGFDYYATGPSGSTISVQVKRLSGKGTAEKFDDAVSDNTLLSGFRSQNIKNPEIIDRGVDTVNGEDFFFVAINTGERIKERMISHTFFKGYDMYTLTIICSVKDISILESKFKSVVRSFTLE